MDESRNITTTTVTLAQLKSHLRITNNNLDNELQMCLKAATRAAENFTGDTYSTQNINLQLLFKDMVILRKATYEINYVKVDGEEVSDDDYMLRDDVIIFNADIEGEDLEINYVAKRESVDDAVTSAILLSASYLFTHPEDHVDNLPRASINLLKPYRRWRKTE